MKRRYFTTLVATISLAGCTGGLVGQENSQLDLTVRNRGTEPVTFQLKVVDDKGTSYVDETARLEGGAVRTFQIAVGAEGRHEATVSNSTLRSQFTWNAGGCTLFEATVELTDTSVESSSECSQS